MRDERPSLLVWFVRAVLALLVAGFLGRILWSMWFESVLPLVRAAQRDNLRTLWETWKPGLKWLLLGYALIALGSVLINQ